MLLDDGTRKYVWGLGLAYAVDSSGGVEVYHTDGLGSVRALTDAAGTVTQTYQTDEFGVPTAVQGSSGQPFGYTGEQRDGETGFVYLRARMYDPAVGRFVQRDPVAGLVRAPSTLNRYSYVLNNPANQVDPSGLWAVGLCVGADLGLGFYLTGSACIVATSTGQVGVALSPGVGGSTGAKASIGPQIQVSNADTLKELEGPFIFGGGSGGAGIVGGVDVFGGQAGEKTIVGVTISLRGGITYSPPLVPGGVHGGVTTTWVPWQFLSMPGQSAGSGLEGSPIWAWQFSSAPEQNTSPSLRGSRVLKS